MNHEPLKGKLNHKKGNQDANRNNGQKGKSSDSKRKPQATHWTPFRKD